MRRRKEKPKDPARIGGTVHRVLGELGYDMNSPGLLLTRSWEKVVGPEAARHSEPVDLNGDTLEVRADSPGWSQHLQLHRDEILDRVADLLPSGAPTRLRMRIG